MTASKPARDLTREEQRAAGIYTERRGDRLLFVNGATGNEIAPDALVPVTGGGAS